MSEGSKQLNGVMWPRYVRAAFFRSSVLAKMICAVLDVWFNALTLCSKLKSFFTLILAIGSGQRILYWLGSGLWLVPVLVLRRFRFLNYSPDVYILIRLLKSFYMCFTCNAGCPVDVIFRPHGRTVAATPSYFLILTLLVITMGVRTHRHQDISATVPKCPDSSNCPRDI